MRLTIHCTCNAINADIQYTPNKGQEHEARRLIDQIKEQILRHHRGKDHRITITYNPNDET